MDDTELYNMDDTDDASTVLRGRQTQTVIRAKILFPKLIE